MSGMMGPSHEQPGVVPGTEVTTKTHDTIPGHDYETPCFENGCCDYCDKSTVCISMPVAGGGSFKLCGCCLKCMEQDLQYEIDRRNTNTMVRVNMQLDEIMMELGRR